MGAKVNYPEGDIYVTFKVFHQAGILGSQFGNGINS